MEVKAGEIVLLPRNDPHRLGSALNVRAVNANSLIDPRRTAALHVLSMVEAASERDSCAGSSARVRRTRRLRASCPRR